MAVEAGDFVFLASHRGFGDDFTTQCHDILSKIKATLAEFDMTLADLVRVDVRLKNIQDVRIYEKLFLDYFEKGKYPARTGWTTEFVDGDWLCGDDCEMQERCWFLHRAVAQHDQYTEVEGQQ